jgi:hypothetical protein
MTSGLQGIHDSSGKFHIALRSLGGRRPRWVIPLAGFFAGGVRLYTLPGDAPQRLLKQTLCPRPMRDCPQAKAKEDRTFRSCHSAFASTKPVLSIAACLLEPGQSKRETAASSCGSATTQKEEVERSTCERSQVNLVDVRRRLSKSLSTSLRSHAPALGRLNSNKCHPDVNIIRCVFEQTARSNLTLRT